MSATLALAAEMPRVVKRQFVPSHVARQAARAVNRTGIQGRVGKFYELAAMRLVGGTESNLIIGQNQSQPDFVLPRADSFCEVKARGSGSPFRISVGQIEDYLIGIENEQASNCLYFFWEYTVSGSEIGKISEASARDLPSVLAAGTRRLTVLDLRLVAQIAGLGKVEIGRDPDAEDGDTKQVATIGRLMLRAPGSSDGEVSRSFFADLGLDSRRFRVLRGEARVSNGNETPDLFESGRAVSRSVPAVALLGCGEAENLVRDGGPLSGIFPESQLPKTRYRWRRRARGTDKADPF